MHSVCIWGREASSFSHLNDNLDKYFPLKVNGATLSATLSFGNRRVRALPLSPSRDVQPLGHATEHPQSFCAHSARPSSSRKSLGTTIGHECLIPAQNVMLRHFALRMTLTITRLYNGDCAFFLCSGIPLLYAVSITSEVV